MKIEIVKPVVPRFIADWIEQEKKCTTFHKSFSRAINLIKHDEDWREWEYEVGNRWSKIVATAWIHGYEVEQAPLYYAKIKGWEHIGYGHETMYWMFDKTNNSLYVSGTYKFKFHAYGEHNTKFTIDEWNKLGINDTNADFEEV